MSKIGAEKIWAFLHDDPEVVGNTTYVGNTYMYLNKLLKILYCADAIALSEIKQRMYIEKNYGFSKVFEQMREGYGLTEYRIVKLHRIKGIGKNLERYFPELLCLKSKEDILFDIPIPLVDLARLETDEEYRYTMARAFEENEEIGAELTSLFNSGNKIVKSLILDGPELPKKDIGKEKVKK